MMHGQKNIKLDDSIKCG